MDFSSTQGKLPIPMHAPASPFAAGGGGRVLHQLYHEHGNNSNGNESPAKLPPSPAAATTEEGSSSGKKRAAWGLGGGGSAVVKYRECLKNHAAAIGGNATDGCGEFMPSGEEGSLGALRCSACGCHRNFHRKVLDDDVADGCFGGGYGRRLVAPAMAHLNKSPHYAAMRSVPLHHQPLMNAVPLSAAMHGASESDEMDGARGSAVWSAKKRFRTKFTAEQKARMLEFAKRVGWRLQNLDDDMVHAFCQEIGVKRRVLKVWMHNNKHSLAIKRIEAAPEAASPPAPPPQMPMQMVPPPPPPPPPPSSSQPGPSFLLGGPSSPPPPPPFHRGPASPAPFKLE